MSKRPFIIDCDTGTDDAIAILAAYGCPDMDILAITSVNGNVAEKYTSANNLNLVEYLGKETKVARGAALPLYTRGDYYSDTHGSTGLGNCELPTAVKSSFIPETAPELIYKLACEHGKIELLVTGPMTNIAIALSLHPDLKEHISYIWFMGGAAVGGNVSTTAEFNIWVDPYAAKIVIESGIPMTMVGLDVTEKAIMLPDDEKELRGFGTKAGIFAADLLQFMFDRCAKGGEDAMMHDSLALAAAFAPECLKCTKYFVDVECVGEYTAGHTMVEMKSRRNKDHIPNVEVALEIDVPAFRKWLVKSIGNCRG